MATDYIGNNGDDFHLTLQEHRMVFELLERTGADLKEWSWANDGSCISMQQCKNWARILRTNLSKMRLPHQAEKHKENPVPGTPWQIMGVEDYRRIISEFADFLDSCGGCKQT